VHALFANNKVRFAREEQLCSKVSNGSGSYYPWFSHSNFGTGANAVDSNTA